MRVVIKALVGFLELFYAGVLPEATVRFVAWDVKELVASVVKLLAGFQDEFAATPE